MSLATPASVQKLQTALHAKAKASPDFRFYALYDKVYRRDVLVHAYERCEANGGAAGVDNQTFEDIERYGVERWLSELTQELKSRTYQPQPVRRVYIPKPDGKQRPLGIPTIRDRVVQTAAVLVLEPIFEADLTRRCLLHETCTQLIGNSNPPRCSRGYLFSSDETIIQPAMNSGSVDAQDLRSPQLLFDAIDLGVHHVRD